MIIIQEEEEEEEREKFDETNKLQVVKRLLPMIVDQVCAKLIESKSIMGFKGIQYDSLNSDDQVKLECTMIDMMIKFRHTPLELGIRFLVGLYKEWMENENGHFPL